MPSNQVAIRHLFEGGWATDFGQTAEVPIEPAGPGFGFLRLPFLADAENCLYELNGGPHKMPGLSKLNSSALASGATIKGLFDYWISGSGGSSTQHRVVAVGTVIMEDDADGTFVNLFTGMTAGLMVNFFVFDDILIISNGQDVPKSWDGSTAQNLAGSPPNFTFGCSHKNRAWAAGVNANPSRLYYSASLNPEDWAGAGSGSIDIDPNDGDRITAIISHRNELIVFKGPYKGSVHRITGSSPSDFARTTFVEGIGAVGQSSLFRFGNDVGFVWSDGSIRSLSATAEFGDYDEVALSRPIQTWLREHLTMNRLTHITVADWQDRGVVLFGVPIDSVQNPNCVLAMDYRFSPVRWSLLSALTTQATALASVVDASDNNRRIVMGGGSDGYVRKFGRASRSIDGATSISFKVTSPFLNYLTPLTMKTFVGGSVGLVPKNSGSFTLGWYRDNNAQQSLALSQSGGSELDSFELDVDTLGGSRFVDRFFSAEEGGEFRSIAFQVTHNTVNEDIEIHSITGMAEVGAMSLENS